MEPITIALIAVVQVVILAIAQGALAHRAARLAADIKREEKAEDYARQDLVAARVDAAVKEAAARQVANVVRTEEVAKKAAEVAERISGQLETIDEQGKKIHILVNSDMTAARTNERDQTQLLLIALKRVRALSALQGMPHDEEESDAIARAEARIDELNQILADRLAAQQKVDAHDQKKR